MLLEGGKEVKDEDFEFLQDEMEYAIYENLILSLLLTFHSFLDAKEPLLKSALIDRLYNDKSLSVHRLVQEAVMRRLSAVDRVKYFDRVTTLLSNGFPNSWNTVTSHQFTAWAKCEIFLPHVNFLMKQSEKLRIESQTQVSNPHKPTVAQTHLLPHHQYLPLNVMGNKTESLPWVLR